MRELWQKKIALDNFFFKYVWCEQSVLLLSDLKWLESKSKRIPFMCIKRS